MNTMQRAHQYARDHRSEFDTYKEALRQGLKLAHQEARRAREKPQVKHELLEALDTPETRAAAIIREGVEKYRARIPLLCRDWKADDYNGRRDFCRYQVIR
jgi:hypothetical protein